MSRFPCSPTPPTPSPVQPVGECRLLGGRGAARQQADARQCFQAVPVVRSGPHGAPSRTCRFIPMRRRITKRSRSPSKIRIARDLAAVAPPGPLRAQRRGYIWLNRAPRRRPHRRCAAYWLRPGCRTECRPPRTSGLRPLLSCGWIASPTQCRSRTHLRHWVFHQPTATHWRRAVPSLTCLAATPEAEPA